MIAVCSVSGLAESSEIQYIIMLMLWVREGIKHFVCNGMGIHLYSRNEEFDEYVPILIQNYEYVWE